MSAYTLDPNELKVGVFIELAKGPHAGLMQVTKTRRLSDGENLFIQVTIDKDIETPGDELILEFHLNSPREVAILRNWETFPKANANTWPPPLEVVQEEDGKNVTFKSFSDSTRDQDHKPFSAWLLAENATQGKLRPGQLLDLKELLHYEYQDGTGENLLSIWEEDGVVYMWRGYVLNAIQVKVI